jgi:hypothetical protein
MLICFFDIWGIIYFEFVPKGATIWARHTKETGNRDANTISEKCRRFQAGNWFAD